MPIEIKNKLSTKGPYRPEIDGLRAFAVIAVIINHFNKDILPGGYLGVDIFFVISGFVITSSLNQRPSKNFKDFISGFYERRIKRLVPALSVFVLITSIAICFFNSEPILSLRTGLTSLFGLSNLYLLQKSTDYFAQSTELNVFTHTWSLGVEEQFYILFPFLIWFSGFGRQTKNGARNLFLIVGALTITSLIGFLYLYTSNQPAAYFLMPTRFWEMATGCLIFIGFNKRKSIEQLLEKIPPLIVLLLIIGVMYLPMSLATASTISVVALSAVLIASLKKQTTAFKIFTHPKVVYIGLISYSLYLWHWGVLSLSRWTIGIHWWSVPLQVVLMFGLAVASYRWIETPLRQGYWFGKRWLTLVTGVSVLCITALANLLIITEKRFSFLISKTKFDYNLTEGKVINSTINRKNCHLRPTETIITDLDRCSYQILHTKSNLYLVGDSHANAFVPFYEIKSIKAKYNLVTMTRGGGIFPSYREKRDDLDRLNSERFNFIFNESKKGDTLLIINNYSQDLDPVYTSRNNPILSSKRRIEMIEKYIKKLSKISIELQSKGVNVVVMLPLPNFNKSPIPFDLKRCKESIFLNRQTMCRPSMVLREEMLKRNADVVNLLSKNASRGGYITLNPFDAVCPERMKYCSTHLDNDFASSPTPVFRDYDHLSREGAKIISVALEDFFINLKN